MVPHIAKGPWTCHACAQFVAGNLASVERRLPHPDGGEERVMRVWGTPDRSAQHATVSAPHNKFC